MPDERHLMAIFRIFQSALVAHIFQAALLAGGFNRSINGPTDRPFKWLDPRYVSKYIPAESGA